jgi:translation initiation factor 3 subunit H
MSTATVPLPSDQEEIKIVEVDALVILQIMKHCRQQAPQPVTGQLLGVDVGDVLQVTHSFGSIPKGVDEHNQPQDDGEQYSIDMLRSLREVNVDSQIVGWYQTTHLGQFFSEDVIKMQYEYQMQIPQSTILVYDPLQSRIGKPAFKALRLTSEFMTKYTQTREANRSALYDFPSGDMFMEIPLSITSLVIVESFLVDWAISDPMTMSQVPALDVENQVFLEKNVQLLIQSLQVLSDEQMKMQTWERQAMRGQDGKGGGKGKGYRQAQPPKQLDTMIISQQIQNYCKQINNSAGDAFGKVFLLSNKPGGTNK